jgi:hypothetical protein
MSDVLLDNNTNITLDIEWVKKAKKNFKKSK